MILVLTPEDCTYLVDVTHSVLVPLKADDLMATRDAVSDPLFQVCLVVALMADLNVWIVAPDVPPVIVHKHLTFVVPKFECND